MNFLNSLLSSPLLRFTGSAGNQQIHITFTPTLPPAVRTQLATQPLNLTVSEGSGNKLSFTAPDGTTYNATVSPSLPRGTQVQLTFGSPDAAGQPTLQARILTPDAAAQPSTPSPTQGTTTGSAHSTAPVTQPNQPAVQPPVTTRPMPTITLPTNTTSTPTLHNVIATTLMQATIAAAQVANPQTAGQQLLPVPAGPVASVFPQGVATTLIGQLLTLTPTAPMQPDGTQQATLTPATPSANGTAPQPTPLTLNLGVPLPVGTPQTATLLPSTATGVSQPTLMLTGDGPSTPLAANPNLKIGNLTPQLTEEPQLTATAPRTMPVSGRVLPPTVPAPFAAPATGAPVTTQNVLLANGTVVPLALPPSSQPLPTGSIIVAEFPINPSSGVQRIVMADAQTQAQPNTQQGQQTTAGAVPPQTTQAVLAPGMVLQGVISGQNEAGQLLITISQPASMNGQVAVLNITPQAPQPGMLAPATNTALLPLGAQLSVRMETSLAATILGLTLPPQTQAAYTVGTIGTRWEGLQQALTTLQTQAPVQAANLRASLPQLANLLPGLIAFTNALRTNDSEKAFDREATRLLKSMGLDLSSDISQLSQLQQRPGPQTEHQWRGTLFPYVEAPGEDPRQGGFFWRREKKDDPRASTATRFVVEVEMSRMGAMQLDGLLTYPDIWLKLRRTSLPEDGFVQELQTMVTNLLQSYGLNGGIAVETTATFPVNPRAELLAETENPLPTSA